MIDLESKIMRDIIARDSYRSHFITHSLSSKAKGRLHALGLSEFADGGLFSTNAGDQMTRIIFIHKPPYLYFLWWDPEHEVCPPKAKS